VNLSTTGDEKQENGDQECRAHGKLRPRLKQAHTDPRTAGVAEAGAPGAGLATEDSGVGDTDPPVAAAGWPKILDMIEPKMLMATLLWLGRP